MNALLMLIPVALVLGLLGLGAFLWALRSGQFDDLDGAAHRILFDEDDMPGTPPAPPAVDEKTDPGKDPKP
ncbi:MAG: cytochrome oxidase maturation protein Cbb3 [Rhodospirillaceae bacterium BRH_c57]|nr:MAG: cytochrome oxidase maturation protein Cbb3 [Rhodospirillaceae bacterium BRH_c57]